MIYEMLERGRQNAKTAKELCVILGLTDKRIISRAVERERRAGHPICASCNGKAHGYYLPDSREELKIYVDSLYKRGGELFKTRRALLKSLEEMEE